MNLELNDEAVETVKKALTKLGTEKALKIRDRIQTLEITSGKRSLAGITIDLLMERLKGDLDD